MRQAKLTVVGLMIAAVSLLGTTAMGASGPDPTDPETLRQISRELKQLEKDRSQDQQKIEKLENRVEELETENSRLKSSSTEIKAQTTQTTELVKKIEEQQSEASVSPQQFSNFFDRYLGTHTFTVTGAAGVNFIYDSQTHPIDGIHNASQNTFLLDWEPMILYRPNDWMLFQGVISTSFGAAGTGTDLSTADFQIFLNDYVTLEAGLFDNPFGDWYEAQSPMWVNRFVTAPLPFGVEPVVPPAEIGLQIRGGMQWGEVGQDFDYTVWGGNGPNFSEPITGASMSSPTAIAFSQTNGKSFGGRFRVYPLPADSNLGRLELGVSTYNGKWMNGKWLTSWGVDFNYMKGHFQARGEWLQSYRQVPQGQLTDNRKGGYIQAGYFLSGVNLSWLPQELNKHIQRLEPLIRFSGVQQRAVAIDDIQGATGIGMNGIQVGLVPDFGLSGSPALYAPHSRELALALDYYISPSIIWQNELDFELPRSGGLFSCVKSSPAPCAAGSPYAPVGSVPNDHAFLSQFTIGF
jgi:hypothetical protein